MGHHGWESAAREPALAQELRVHGHSDRAATSGPDADGRDPPMRE